MAHADGVSKHPVLMSFPFLPLQRALKAGPWAVTPLDQFDGMWADPAFEVSAQLFLGSFRTAGGEPIPNPAVVSRGGVVDGTHPTAAEASALRRAVGLGVVVANPYWSDGTRHQGYPRATVDNADLWIQPLDVIGHHITLERGSRISTLVGGHRLTDDGFTIPAPLELPLPAGAGCDEEVAGALYNVTTSPRGPSHIGTAVDWLLKSWLNSASISENDRIVFLKTAIEALTGESSTGPSGAALRVLFAGTADQEGSGLGVDRLLWRPEERMLTRSWMGKTKAQSEELTELEHWYGALADARNEIIHDGTSGDGWYREIDSPYAGPIAEVADRVTREAILVSLGEAGFPAVWRDGLGRASLAVLRPLAPDG